VILQKFIRIHAHALVREHWHGVPIMRDRLLNLAATCIITAAIGAVVTLLGTQTSAQGPMASVIALKTPWGAPDLQGIWTEEFDTPFQRPAKYANQEFFTEAQRAELDNRRSALLARLGTEPDFLQAYNLSVFTSVKRTGVRTSLVVDPPNGRIPPRTEAARKAV